MQIHLAERDKCAGASHSALLMPFAYGRNRLPRAVGKEATMRYFVRTLKHAWVYRVRLVVSLVCALFAAIFWSLNFTAIYPTLKILGSEDNLQEWINSGIQSLQDEKIPK